MILVRNGEIKKINGNGFTGIKEKKGDGRIGINEIEGWGGAEDGYGLCGKNENGNNLCDYFKSNKNNIGKSRWTLKEGKKLRKKKRN